MLVGLGGIAHVATNLDRISGLWGLALGCLGLLALGSLLVSRKITVADGTVEFKRVINEHPDLRLVFSEIRGTEYNAKTRHFEVRASNATYRVRISRDAAKKLSKVLKEAGLKTR